MAVTVLAPPTLQVNATFKQGADATITLTVVDANGNPISNPTGYAVRAQIRSTPAGVVLFEWNTTSGPGIGAATLTYTPGPPAVSTVTLTLTAAQSALFTFASAQWDCLLTNPAGQVTCLAEGIIAIDPQVTH